MEKEKVLELKPAPASAPDTQDQHVSGNSFVRTASPEKFKKAHAKTSIRHAGLFRRLREREWLLELVSYGHVIRENPSRRGIAKSS